MIVLFEVAFVASLCIPVGMAALAPGAARRVLLGAWLLLMPINAISCITFARQGEAGFLSDAQWISDASLLLILSFGLGYAASRARHSWRHRKRAVGRFDLE